jgi:hypothetical protein
VVEQKVSRGNFHPLKERKGKIPLRSEQLKLKRIKTCIRRAPGKHLLKVLRDNHLKAYQAQEQSTEKLKTYSTFACKDFEKSAEVKNLFEVQH